MSSATQPLSFDELPRGAGGVGASEQIAKTLTEQGLNATVGLYDEALALARDGHLARAAERLRMVLVLDPNDAEAAVLLGKVQAGRGMWQEALAHLDEAAAKGASLPQGLRDAVEGRQQAKVREEEEIRTQAAQRDKSEIRNLRAEAKRLRAENTDLEANVEELQRRVKSWSVATALVSGVALALLGGVMIFGGPDEAPATALAAGPTVANVEGAGAPITTVAPGAEAPPTVAVSVPATVGSGAGTPTMTPAPLPTATPVATAPITTTPITTTPVATTPVAPAPAVAATGNAGMTTEVVKPSTSAGGASAKANTGAPPAVAKASPAPMNGPGKTPVAKKADMVVAVKATHTVRNGETLGSIAQRYYKDSAQWPKILKANPSLKGASSLRPGMKLKIPK